MLKCPHCDDTKLQVCHTPPGDGSVVVRIRACRSCMRRYRTVETIQDELFPQVPPLIFRLRLGLGIPQRFRDAAAEESTAKQGDPDVARVDVSLCYHKALTGYTWRPTHKDGPWVQSVEMNDVERFRYSLRRVREHYHRYVRMEEGSNGKTEEEAG